MADTQEKAKKNKEEFFIKLPDPLDMRRNLLESSKSILKCMRSYEKIAEIRSNKLETMIRLRSLIRDINQLFVKFRQKLPKNKFVSLPARMAKEKFRAPTGEEIGAIEKEISKVESALSEIEK